VNNRIQLKELLDLLKQLPPEEVARQYGERLDAESKQHFTDFQTIVRDLDGLPEEVGLLAPEMPQVSVPEKGNVVPMRRRWQLPAWSLPLTAAATFALGVMVPRTEVIQQPVPIVDADKSGLDNLRTIEFDRMLDKDQTRFDLDIASSYFERGAFFYELGNEESYRRAMKDFEMAYRHNTKDARVLDYLIITAEELGDSDAKEWYEGLRTKLEE